MPTYNVQTKAIDKNGKRKHLGRVYTQIPDRGRAQELAERKHGENVTVVRESHLELVDGQLTKVDD